MWMEKQKMNRKARIFLACGCICLAFGTGLPVFVHLQPGPGLNWFDASRGLLMGLAIGLNLCALILGRRKCAVDSSEVDNLP
jgi:hypothetical protein